MDLNQLFHRQQVSLMRASAAACPEARIAHQGLAAGYAARIETLRGELNAEFPLREAGR
mgnify:CR=1 FL=1|jgi:hypothetical protein